MKSNCKNLHLLAFVSLGLTSPSAFAAALTWDTVAGDASTITAGGGTWDTSNTAWNDAGTDLAWSQTATNDGSNTATFAGVDAAVDAYEVSLGEDIAAEGVTFNSTGYKITGSTLALISVLEVTGTATGLNGAITVAAGKTATINSILLYNNNKVATVTSNLDSILNLDGSTTVGSNPQMNLSGAGTINITGTYGSTVGSWKAKTMNQTGGTVNMIQGGANVGHVIGRDGVQDQTYTISGGVLNARGLGGGTTALGYFLGLGRTTGNFKATLVVKDSGVVNIGNVADRSGQLNLGSNDWNGNSLLDMQGGTLTIGTGKATNRLLFFAAGANAGKTATMTQSGGVVTSNGIQFGANTGVQNVDGGGSHGGIDSTTGNPTTVNSYDATSLATLQLSGGSLYVGQMGILRGTAAASLPVAIKLQGGTLGASANWASSLDMALGTATIQAANSSGAANSISLAGILSNESGVGTLAKTGSGELSLSGANTYTGATSVNAGTLLVNAPGSLVASSAVTVASGAALGGSGTINGTVNLAANALLAPGATGTIGTLTLANDSASSLVLNGNSLFFDLPNTGTTCDLVNITGANGKLALNGANTIALTAPHTVPAGTYTLMTYASKTGSGTLTFPNGSDTFGNASLTVGPTAVTLTVSAGGLTGLGLAWKGDVSGVWDGGILNWTNNGTSQAYADGDAVVFDDSGSNAAVISSGAPVSPSAVYFNNIAKSYTVSAVIAGATVLNKLGPATTILTGANTYTGDTTISSGTLQISGAGRLNAGNYAAAMSIAPGATFESAIASTQTLSGAITGGGTLKNSGGGGMILSNGSNSYGALSISSANSRVFIGTNAAALPAAATVDITSGALVFAVDSTRANAITVSSGGTVTARAATTLENVTLPGSGTVIFNNDDADTNLLTISNGQTLTGTLTAQIGGHRMLSTTTVLGGVTLSGNLTGSGGLVVASSGNPDNNPTLFGTGVLTLSGTNTYTGDTTVNSGVLAVTGTSIPDTGKLVINDPGKVDLTNAETVSKLFFGATEQPLGTYSASSVPVGATIPTSSFTGSGTLTVVPTAGGFSSWITGTFANGTVPTGKQGPNDDPDNDGISNLVEYAVAGQDPTVGNPAIGSFNGTTLSFAKRLDASGLTYAIQDSADLGITDAWAEVSGDLYVNNASTISYTLTPGTPPRNFLRLQVLSN